MKKWVVPALSTAVLTAAIAFTGYQALSRAKPEMKIATWDGDYGHAQISAQIMPFGTVSGTNTLVAIYNGGTKELAQQVSSRSYEWDAVDMELPDAVAACDHGLLEKIDAKSLPAASNGTPAASDFVPGAIGPCWVASTIYAQVIAVSPRVTIFARNLDGFFDVKNYPGKRALNKTSAKQNVEMALLADGVTPQDVYAVLSTPQGLARALKKLDTLRGNILWYSNAAEAAALLKSGEASYAAMPNWAVFDANKEVGPAINILWDRQLYQLEVFGIPKGHPRAAMAMDFIRYATSSRPLGAMASWIPYGPARKSALAFVTKQPETQIKMEPYLPTAHLETAFAIDAGWWRLHGADVNGLWQQWLTVSDPH